MNYATARFISVLLLNLDCSCDVLPSGKRKFHIDSTFVKVSTDSTCTGNDSLERMIDLWVKVIACGILLMKRVQAEDIYPQCYSFTWIGAYVHNQNVSYDSCDRRVGKYNEIPCQLPFVVTNNNKVPDTLELWRSTTRDAYLCNMEPGWSCVKYMYIFKNGIQNITYMCAKVNATNGCYRQTQLSGMEIEACVCNSKLGLIPCNSAMRTLSEPLLLLGLAIAILCITSYKIS